MASGTKYSSVMVKVYVIFNNEIIYIYTTLKVIKLPRITCLALVRTLPCVLCVHYKTK